MFFCVFKAVNTLKLFKLKGKKQFFGVGFLVIIKKIIFTKVFLN